MIEIIKNSLYHTRVQEQTLYFVPLPIPPPAGRLTVDKELVAPDRDNRIPLLYGA